MNIWWERTRCEKQDGEKVLHSPDVSGITDVGTLDQLRSNRGGQSTINTRMKQGPRHDPCIFIDTYIMEIRSDLPCTIDVKDFDPQISSLSISLHGFTSTVHQHVDYKGFKRVN